MRKKERKVENIKNKEKRGKEKMWIKMNYIFYYKWNVEVRIEVFKK